jgi:hypothetical protein
LETLSPLAAKLKPSLQIDLTFHKGQEIDLAHQISTLEGTILVCWQHENILAIAQALKPVPLGLPSKWPGKRYNVIFRFDRAAEASTWTFQQLAPAMLADDPTDPI